MNFAQIICEEGEFYIIDQGSKLGTYVNKQRVKRQKLQRNDRIDFGIGVTAYAVFDPAAEESSVAREFLSQISVIAVKQESSDLEKLALFLEAARKLNTTGALEEILLSLIQTTLKLTGADRGFIFLRNPDASLFLAAACTAAGERLTSDETISHSILDEAANSASEFLISDSTQHSEMAARESIVAHDLRTVVPIPLRKAHSHGKEAAALVESTHLAKAEEEGRRYQQELTIAAAIQQRLMTVSIPELNFARLSARNLPCRDIGGDFFDVVSNDDGLTLVMTDVSGKGISAAILASILQGLIYAQVVARVPLENIATATNTFLCQRILGEKYATAVIVRISVDGNVEYVNCGHEPPVLVRGGKAHRMESANMPVGLIAEATYIVNRMQLEPDDRLILMTDGITEAEDRHGEFFGIERLTQAAEEANGPCFEHIFTTVRNFCGEVPLNDDCTLLELHYLGSEPEEDSTATLKPVA
jgi:serine phosphatase RsbU (regulator of sigma subunit)